MINLGPNKMLVNRENESDILREIVFYRSLIEIERYSFDL